MRLNRLGIIVALTIIYLMSATFLNSAQEQRSIEPSGNTSFDAVFKGTKVNITILTVRLNKDFDKVFPLIRMPEVKEVFIIRNLRISIDGHDLFVPRSIFADLINPRWVSSRYEKGSFILSISGGDGADSYFLNVYFGKTEIKRRVFYSTLIPNKPTEDTRYFLRVLKDE